MKVYKDDDSSEFMIVRIIVGAVLLLFTYYGFFDKQPCDIDAIYLSCRLNPFTVWDFIGCCLFYGGSLVLAGVPKLFGANWFNPTGSSYYWVVFVSMVGGIVMIWS